MKGQVDAEKINLLFVKTLKSNIEVGSNFRKRENQEYQLSIGKDTGLNLDEKKIIFNLKVLIKFPDENADFAASAEFVLQFLFEIDNLNELSELNEDGKPIVSGDLTLTLAGIAYSTSRGVILTKTEQSDLKGILLPVINPITLLTETEVSK